MEVGKENEVNILDRKFFSLSRRFENEIRPGVFQSSIKRKGTQRMPKAKGHVTDFFSASVILVLNCCDGACLLNSVQVHSRSDFD